MLGRRIRGDESCNMSFVKTNLMVLNHEMSDTKQLGEKNDPGGRIFLWENHRKNSYII